MGRAGIALGKEGPPAAAPSGGGSPDHAGWGCSGVLAWVLTMPRDKGAPTQPPGQQGVSSWSSEAASSRHGLRFQFVAAEIKFIYRKI